MPFDQLNHDRKVVGEEIKRRRATVSAAYEKMNKKFAAIPGIVHFSISVLRRRPTDGTLFQPAITALQELGIDTPKTIGGLITSLELDPDDILDIAQDCGHAITSKWLAEKFTILAERP